MARAAEDPGVRRFTVDEYHRMVDAGILRQDDRVELIDGVIREMSPTNRPHAIATTAVRQLLDRGLAGRASVYEEKPLRLEDIASEPEPDVCVCSNPDLRAFGTESTEPLLVVEVAESSLMYDMTTKAELYAKGDVPEYWVVDLANRVVHVFRNARHGAYRTKMTKEPGTRVAPLSWPDFEIDVATLFPSG